MTSKGLKRKFPVEPEEIGPAWEHQRQSVLDISIEKFQRDLSMVEPSLRRSVLIANTLRQIQLEEPMPSPNDTVVPPVEPVKTRPAPVQQSNFSHQGPVQSLPAVAYCPTLTENHGDEWMSTSAEEEFSLSTAISSILKELDGDGCQDSSQPSLSPPQRMPLGSIENLPGSLDAGPRHRPGWTGQRGEECGRRVEGSPLGSMAVTRPTYLHDVTLDSLFVDVDMSVFDREVSSLGARAFSTIANEELVKYLPSLSGSHSPTLSNQGVKDLHELEHIMEILVES
ncbi:cell division cycle-associated protein 4 [Alosa sapidissima]|uniref:cell division cycle-associated protein 4 n=1 Tax=Alosa sapidissima TaxID=34773 RepID=UPI001C09F6E6|nr:cell division cycle-associated protein 4 [Alosa sapidissima]XP_041919823.1 cell division cycle-associated protein 4 [Alosa sapidissima]